MAIVDDYPAIAAELRRLQAEQGSLRGDRTAAEREQVNSAPAAQHPMRATSAGESLYRRLVLRGRR
jgi:hypothetical protein